MLVSPDANGVRRRLPFRRVGANSVAARQAQDFDPPVVSSVGSVNRNPRPSGAEPPSGHRGEGDYSSDSSLDWTQDSGGRQQQQQPVVTLGEVLEKTFIFAEAVATAYARPLFFLLLFLLVLRFLSSLWKLLVIAVLSAFGWKLARSLEVLFGNLSPFRPDIPCGQTARDASMRQIEDGVNSRTRLRDLPEYQPAASHPLSGHSVPLAESLLPRPLLPSAAQAVFALSNLMGVFSTPVGRFGDGTSDLAFPEHLGLDAEPLTVSAPAATPALMSSAGRRPADSIPGSLSNSQSGCDSKMIGALLRRVALQICAKVESIEMEDRMLEQILGSVGIRYVVEHPLVSAQNFSFVDENILSLHDRNLPPMIATALRSNSAAEREQATVLLERLNERRRLEAFVLHPIPKDRLYALQRVKCWLASGVFADVSPAPFNWDHRRGESSPCDGDLLHHILFTWLGQQLPALRSTSLPSSLLSTEGAAGGNLWASTAFPLMGDAGIASNEGLSLVSIQKLPTDIVPTTTSASYRIVERRSFSTKSLTNDISGGGHSADSRLQGNSPAMSSRVTEIFWHEPEGILRGFGLFLFKLYSLRPDVLWRASASSDIHHFVESDGFKRLLRLSHRGRNSTTADEDAEHQREESRSLLSLTPNSGRLASRTAGNRE